MIWKKLLLYFFVSFLACRSLFSQGLVKEDFNKDIYFGLGLLDFDKYYTENAKDFNEALKQVRFVNELKDTKVMKEFHKNEFVITLVLPDRTTRTEEYIYKNGFIKERILTMGNYRQQVYNFGLVKKSPPLKDVNLVSFLQTDSYEGKLVKVTSGVLKSAAKRDNLKLFLKEAALKKALKDGNVVRRSNERYSMTLYRDWLSFKKRMWKKNIGLYGIWMANLDGVAIPYVFDIEYCSLGDLRGKCLKYDFNKKTGKGSFLFLKTAETKAQKFDYKVSRFKLYLRNNKAEPWIEVKDKCSGGSFPLIYSSGKERTFYSCY